MSAGHGGETDRWFGVFRSVGHAPITQEAYAQASRHRQRAVRELLIGGVLLLTPLLPVMTHDAAVPLLGQLAVFMVALLGGVFGTGMLLGGAARYRHLRRIDAEDDLEFFEGEATRLMGSTALAPVLLPGQDPVTQRLLSAALIAPMTTHRLAVHPETGLLLCVDGAPVSAFVGGDIATTARVGAQTTDGPNDLGPRALSALERRELALMAERLKRLDKLGRWGRFCAGAGVLWVIVTVMVADGTVSGVGAVMALTLGALAVVMAFVRSNVRALQRDGEVGAVRDGLLWMLPESGLCWEAEGLPGPARLARGGLGSVADGTARPMAF